jgi:hypothetical protein
MHLTEALTSFPPYRSGFTWEGSLFPIDCLFDWIDGWIEERTSIRSEVRLPSCPNRLYLPLDKHLILLLAPSAFHLRKYVVPAFFLHISFWASRKLLFNPFSLWSAHNLVFWYNDHICEHRNHNGNLMYNSSVGASSTIILVIKKTVTTGNYSSLNTFRFEVAISIQLWIPRSHEYAFVRYGTSRVGFDENRSTHDWIPPMKTAQSLQTASSVQMMLEKKPPILG